MDKLKPCPFCGGTAMVSLNSVYGFVPWCENPDCILNDLTHGYNSVEEAIEAWNRRVEENGGVH